MASNNIKPAKKIEVRSAGAKGRGVFATHAIAKDEVIEISPVIALTADDSVIIQQTSLHAYTFANQGDPTEMQSCLALGLASLYNHSDKPNADFTVNSKIVVIRAKSPIKKGTEITIDYGWEGDEAFAGFELEETPSV
jgi:SET domain-containing protein